MPLITFPAGLQPAQQNWSLERFDTRYDGQAGTFQTRTVPGARWRCTLVFPPLKEDNSRLLQAFLARASDLANRFELPDFSAKLLGTGGGTPVVRGANQTGRSILTEGWPAGTAILKAGDMVQLGTNRLHIVTADVTSSPGGIVYDEDGNALLTEDSPPAEILVDGEGRASIPIEPALQSSPINGQQVQTGLNAKAVFMLDSGYSAASTPGIFTGISIEVVQDLAWSE
jgi:hypothetical protein